MFNIDEKTMEVMKKHMKNKHHLQLTIGVLKDEQMVHKVYNESSEMDTAPIYSYEIGSITKPFTTTLLAKYILEEKVSLDDSIKKYLSELTSDQYYPTLRRLATHTAGYKPILPLNFKGYIKALISILNGKFQSNNPFLEFDQINNMKNIIKNHKLRDMDYRYSYSNFGMGVLGHILGEISGQGYMDTINDYIVNELGLNNTCLGAPSEISLRGYDKKNKDCGNWEWGRDGFLSAAGGIHSTVIDLLQFAKMNIYDDKPYLSYSHQKHAEGNKKYDMGLGWQLQKESNVIWHDGATGSFTAFLGFDKNKKIAVVILSNYQLLSIRKIAFPLLESLQTSTEKILT